MIKPETRMPEISLNNQDGTPVQLNGLRGRNVVLFSFPANTAACNNLMSLIERMMERFTAANAVVMGLSNAKASSLRRLKQEQRLSYDLLADAKGQVLPAGHCGYLVIDERGVVLESGSHLDSDTSVERALRAVKIHTAVRYAQV